MSKWDLQQLLRRVCETDASDLILSVGTAPRIKLHGILQPFGAEELDAEGARQIVQSVLNPEQLRSLDAHRSIDLSRGYEGLARFRMNIFYQRDTLALAIRRIAHVIPPFDQLGLPEIVKDFAMRPHGLFLVTGPAGSGKSTTLAWMLDYINTTKAMHIVCIEDPIEYLHQHKNSVIEQREILSDAHTFAEALRSVFRQSPDIIMVGEMRDLETMQLALTLAETGHLIMATLHTQDTTHAVNRIVDMFPAHHQQQIYVQLSMVLTGIVSQQLLIARDGTRRVLAYEVLNANNAIRNLIREAQVQQIYSVIQTGRADGMITMNDALWQLCERQMIDGEIAVRRSPRPKEMVRMLSSKR